MTQQEFKAARHQLKLTQAQIAGALGVTRMSVHRWESGARKIAQPVALAVAHLNCKTVDNNGDNK